MKLITINMAIVPATAQKPLLIINAEIIEKTIPETMVKFAKLSKLTLFLKIIEGITLTKTKGEEIINSE